MNCIFTKEFCLKYMLASQLYIFLSKVFVLVDECLPGFYIIFFKVLHHMTLDIQYKLYNIQRTKYLIKNVSIIIIYIPPYKNTIYITYSCRTLHCSDRTNHHWDTFTLSTNHPDYTKPATPTMISMLCFVCLLIFII
jgi:hypothetical protein